MAARVKTVDAWEEESGAGATYEVNIDDGFVNVSQGTNSFGQDVLSAISPKDALRMASALILAAEEAKTHRRWQPNYDGQEIV